MPPPDDVGVRLSETQQRPRLVALSVRRQGGTDNSPSAHFPKTNRTACNYLSPFHRGFTSK